MSAKFPRAPEEINAISRDVWNDLVAEVERLGRVRVGAGMELKDGPEGLSFAVRPPSGDINRLFLVAPATAVSGNSGLYLSDYYGPTAATGTFNAAAGFVSDPTTSSVGQCYALNLAENANSPATHWITDSFSNPSLWVPGATYLAMLSNATEVSDGLPLLYFWGFPLRKPFP